MNTKPFEYKPFQRYVINTAYGYTGTLEKSLGMRRWVVKTLPLGTLVEAGANSITQIINRRRDYWCYSCYDTGMIERFDFSTDALCGYDICPDCKPIVPAWKQGPSWCCDYSQFYPSDATPPF